jgi:hypothetical protein
LYGPNGHVDEPVGHIELAVGNQLRVSGKLVLKALHFGAQRRIPEIDHFENLPP